MKDCFSFQPYSNNSCKLYLARRGVSALCWSVLFSENWRCVATCNNWLYQHNFLNSVWWLVSLCHILVILPLFHSSSLPLSPLSSQLALWDCYFDQLSMTGFFFYHNSFTASWLVQHHELLTYMYSLGSNYFTNWSLPHLPFPFCRPPHFLK